MSENQDQAQTRSELHKADLELHALYDRHRASMGAAVQGEFQAIYIRAAGRLEMLKIIFERLYETAHAMHAVDEEFGRRFPNAEREPPHEAEFGDLLDDIWALDWTFHLDHDSMLVFGSLFLDDWSLLAAIGQGLDRSQVSQFETFLNLVQGSQCPRSLAEFRASTQNGMGSYLCIAVRAFRNKLLVHQARPWQRTIKRHSEMPLVFLTNKVPEEVLPLPEVIEIDVRSIRKQFKLSTDEGKSDVVPAKLAAALLGIATGVTSQAERQVITRFIETYGLMHPPFQLVFQRLASFVLEASPLC
jgi:hypothetical protein